MSTCYTRRRWLQILHLFLKLKPAEKKKNRDTKNIDEKAQVDKTLIPSTYKNIVIDWPPYMNQTSDNSFYSQTVKNQVDTGIIDKPCL